MKPTLSLAAAEKLLAAAKYSAEHPEHFDMSDYVSLNSDSNSVPEQIKGLVINGWGTTGCIAGNLVLLYRPELYAVEILGQLEIYGKEAISYIAQANLPTDNLINYFQLNFRSIVEEILEVDDTDTLEELDDLFRHYTRTVSANNVVQVVQAFIDNGLEGVETFLDKGDDL